MKKKLHIPVLLEEVVGALQPRAGESYLDLTAGYGGHAANVLDKIGPSGQATLVDRDINAINHLKKTIAVDDRVTFIHDDFAGASQNQLAEGKLYDCVLADLGISSPHIDNPDRGFSFQAQGPLDMRMDQSLELTAKDVVNTYEEQALADVFFRYGEIKQSRKIAKLIVDNRPFATTAELASVIPGPAPAKTKLLARVFQALRIEVNDELNQLKVGLEIWPKLLKPGGRLAVITFHSLEDRMVKQAFNDLVSEGMMAEYILLSKKPVTARRDEIVYNPRARSAKLRALQRK